ncbi:MAG: ferrous iron transport protein B [Thermodesulfobacteriota bacterium]|nr:ferrous iron transport protein B [Thermodesulfobacteriota bacterium]
MLKSSDMIKRKRLVALAGQPNCGKSTVYNAITGASQHVANYPGVTVEKLSGSCSVNGTKIEIVDLPGTYSMTSFSPEERVSRDFILHEKPETIINVADAASIKRSLYLTFQLLEMQIPVILNPNMMDVATRNGISIDAKELEKSLGIPVVLTAIKRGEGKKELLQQIESSLAIKNKPDFKVDYTTMEPYIADITTEIERQTGKVSYPLRWLGIKLMENDQEVKKLLNATVPDSNTLFTFVKEKIEDFKEKEDESPEKHIAFCRYREADKICSLSVKQKKRTGMCITDRIDSLVCHKFLGPVILALVVYALYNLSIIQGYKITNYTWPLLAKLRILTEMIMPDPAFITEPLIRSLSLWFVDSVNALLNYIPIFFILFALIAILEDSGYMPRMAFILDRLLSRFGLHGQSTLPMVLGGVYVGGCAVPAIMSTKGIPDEKARIATMFIIPMLNCLAKIPLYILIINIYFPDHKSVLMMFIATITLILALPVAKILSLTLLKGLPSEPFIMELPTYHLPTLRGVLGRACERIWVFLKKIVTIVAAVAIVIFVLLQFPGLDETRQQWYQNKAETAISDFQKNIAKTSFKDQIPEGSVMDLIFFADRFKKARMGASKSSIQGIKDKFKAENPLFYSITTGKGSKDARKARRVLKKLSHNRKRLLNSIKQEKIKNSFLGQIGHALEPVSKFAGFNWRVNIALLSSFAAKESTVATLGVLYQNNEQDQNQSLEERMKKGETGFTPLHGLAFLLFMALFPPCIATMITIKIQSGSYKMMLMSFGYQSMLGMFVASVVFTGGSLLGLTGLQAMYTFWILALLAAIIVGSIDPKKNATA